MSVFIKGLLACSVGPLKLSLRISSFGDHVLSYEDLLLVQILKAGGSKNLEMSLPSQRLLYEELE